jgi:RNA polymerase sigma-70 factor (ECF subfamily)
MTSAYDALGERLRARLASAQSGDAAAYREFLTEAAGLIRAYVSKRGLPPPAAEDLTQEVLVTVHRKKHLYDPSRPFLPWLFTLTRYRLIDSVRADARRPAGVPWDDAFDPPAPEARLDDVLAVEELLCALPDRARRILKLAKIDGLPLAEVAAVMGLSVAAVKVAIHRAVRRLRREFAA